MWEGECPKFWGGTEEVDKALSIARADLGAVRDTDEVRVAIDAVFKIEFFSRGDDQGLNEITGLGGRRRR